MKYPHIHIAGLALFMITGHQMLAQQAVSLETARQMALAKNNTVKAAEERINAAKAGKELADAAAKPKIDGSVTAFYFGKPLSQILPEYGASPSVTVTQPIYAGGKIKLGRQVAAKGVEIEEAQKALSTVDVIFNTEQAYWNIVSAMEKVKLAVQSKKQLAALHQDLNNQFTAGLIYKNDVLRAEVQLNDAELSITRSKDAVYLSREVLAQLTGLPVDEYVITDTIQGAFGFQLADTNLSTVYAARPEITILQKNMEAAGMQKELLRADMRPTVGISAGGFAAFGKAGINPANTSRNAMASYYGLLSMNIPLFDWGGRKQKVQQQQFAINAQVYQLQEIKEQMAIEVKQAYIQVNQAAKRVELSGASLQQANENLKLSEDRFKAGTIVGKDVLEAQLIWQQAVTAIIDAKVAYRISEAALKKALGKMD
ncbi:MAG: TolC family protein [Chitinophagaceae bacterium]